jgi:hypothetical protein
VIVKTKATRNDEKLNLYALNTEHTPGLVNYWPVVAGSTTVLDVVTMKELASELPTKTSDRFGNLNGAISVRDARTFWTLPPSVYFTGDLTIIGWIKANSLKSYSRFLDCGSGEFKQNVIVALSNGNSGHPCLNVYEQGSPLYADRVASTYFLPINSTWVHLAVSISRTGERAYANGQLILSNQPYATPSKVTRSRCFFGKSNWPNNYADADFDEIKFFDRALSEAEIQRDFKSIKSFMVPLVGTEGATTRGAFRFFSDYGVYLDPIRSLAVNSYEECLDECMRIAVCNLVSFKESESACSLYVMTENAYAFALPDTTLFQKIVGKQDEG